VRRLFQPGQEEAWRAQMLAFADRFGVQIGTPARAHKTRRALALAEFARDRGLLREVWHAVMDAHWQHGRDIESDEVLGEAAEAAGLDRVEALEAIDDEALLQRVDALRDDAAGVGVRAIPAFLIGDERVVGCQPYDAIARMVEGEGIARSLR
jgi:predicted DsbA family dithiol-disulfide isomerase